MRPSGIHTIMATELKSTEMTAGKIIGGETTIEIELESTEITADRIRGGETTFMKELVSAVVPLGGGIDIDPLPGREEVDLALDQAPRWLDRSR